MGAIIADKIIMFFLGTMIFFLPISRAIIEISASCCIVAWVVKRILIFKERKEYNFLRNVKSFILHTSFLNKALMLFMFANFLSLLFSSNIGLSLNAFFAKLSEYVLIFIIVRDTVNSRQRYQGLIWVMLSSLLFIGLDGFFQLAVGHDLFRGRHLFQGRATASF